ncbi:MAG: GIY-YIG nuclease family protein [Patescibacteria group bacterium]
MYFVYILKSLKSKKLYVGYTSNLYKRFKEHNLALVQSTKPYLPWKLVYYEAYFSEEEARHREHNLKLWANAWNQLKRRIKKSIEKVSNAD